MSSGRKPASNTAGAMYRKHAPGSAPQIFVTSADYKVRSQLAHVHGDDANSMVGIYEQPGSALMTSLRKRVEIANDLAGHEHDLRYDHQFRSIVHRIQHRFYSEVTVRIRLNPAELYAFERGVLLQYHVDRVELSSRADHARLSWQCVQHGAQTLSR